MAYFDDLPIGASLEVIYGKAGQIFEEQAKEDPEKYKDPEAFSKAIYYIAEKAQRQDFIHLRGKSKEEIADEMGDYIIDYVRSRGSQK